MKGRKCSIIFMRKVANRLAMLEERYKELSPKVRASKINEQMLTDFCVNLREVQRWKRIVTVAKAHSDNIVVESPLPPSHYEEIAKLPDEKQKEVIEEVAEKKLTYQETALLVQQTLGKSDFKPQLYNVWNFNECDDRFGLPTFKGRIPGQIVQNVIYYFSEENAVVVDPMGGSGTTYDVCQSMNRIAKCYDLEPQRPEISKHDIRDGYPVEAQNCDLVFLDPPYFNMVFNNHKTIEEFYTFIEKLVEDTFKILKSNGIVAFLIEDMTEKGNYCLSGESFLLFRNAGFSYVAHISCPLSTQQFLPQQVEKAKNEKHLLGRNRDLYIFRKE